MMPANIYEVLRKLRPEIDDPENETFNYIRFKSMCGLTFSMDRRTVRNAWDILLDQKVIVPINGKAYRWNQDRIMDLLEKQVVRCN